MSYCAICADPVSEFVMRPLGKDDAMVVVCMPCNDEPARAYDGPDRAYEIPGSSISQADLQRRLREVAEEFQPNDQVGKFENFIMRERTPGWIIVRVRRRGSDGAPRDAQTARRSFATQPWAASVRHLGTDKTYHLYERPNAKAIAEQRRGGAAADPLAEIEKFRKRES